MKKNSIIGKKTGIVAVATALAIAMTFTPVFAGIRVIVDGESDMEIMGGLIPSMPISRITGSGTVEFPDDKETARLIPEENYKLTGLKVARFNDDGKVKFEQVQPTLSLAGLYIHDKIYPTFEPLTAAEFLMLSNAESLSRGTLGLWEGIDEGEKIHSLNSQNIGKFPGHTIERDGNDLIIEEMGLCNSGQITVGADEGETTIEKIKVTTAKGSVKVRTEKNDNYGGLFTLENLKKSSVIDATFTQKATITAAGEGLTWLTFGDNTIKVDLSKDIKVEQTTTLKKKRGSKTVTITIKTISPNMPTLIFNGKLSVK